MSTERVPFFKDLLKRRVPQILGGYLAGSWIILEFLDWLVKRYPISPHIVEFGLVTLASMIPTVILLAYYHGKPGPDQWTRVEKIGIPANLVAAAILLIFVFRGQDLGATTTLVTLIDEQGQQVERSVPKSEFRKSLAIFPLDNESGDTAYEWFVYAIPAMLYHDLSQDIYLNISSMYHFYENLRDAGFPEAVEVPLSLKKKIASEVHMQHFTSGSIISRDGEFLVLLTLYDTKTTKKISENQFSGPDIFSVVDEASVWLKQEMKVPLTHIEKTEDLPASELLTKSIPALKSFVTGLNIIIMDNDWINATEFLEKSVREDETFALAYLNLYICYAYTGKAEKYREVSELLMQYLYKLPERSQFAVKHDYYYGIKQDPEMAMDVAENWVELYPDDLMAHNVLSILYMLRNQKGKVLEEYKKILSLDPTQYDLLLDIGELYMEMGEYEEALGYYQQYADEFPNDVKSSVAIAELYESSGEYELARTNYKKALIVEPDKLSILRSLAKIERELGNFEQSLKQYNELIDKTESAEDKNNLYRHLEDFYFQRGQIGKSYEYLELRVAEMEKYLPSFGVLVRKMDFIGRYFAAGKSDIPFEMMQTAEEQLGPPLDQVIPFGYVDIYLELEEIDSAEKYIEEAEESIRTYHSELNRAVLIHAQGRINELKGDYEQAIEFYQQYFELNPTLVGVNVSIGRCYRMINDYRKAEEHLQKVLAVHPFSPDANYEIALVYYESGNVEKALEHMKNAQFVWEEADPDYEPANNAREKLAEIENSRN